MNSYIQVEYGGPNEVKTYFFYVWTFLFFLFVHLFKCCVKMKKV